MAKTSRMAITHFTTVLLLIFISVSLAHSGEPLDVRINNFPETQQVKGFVSIEGTTRTIKREGILLSPSRRNELSELHHAGKIETEGFRSLSVFLQGEIKSTTFLSGAIGVLLVPDEEPVLRAFKEAKQIQFPIESVCKIQSGDSDFFSCELNNQSIGFSRYRIYLYNTLNKTADVNVYLYLKK